MQRQPQNYGYRNNNYNRNKKLKYSNNNANRVNRFNKKKKEEKNEFVMNEKEFPEIKTENNTSVESKEILNFKNINFEEIVEYKEENKLKKGWIILNKENLAKRIKEKEEIDKYNNKITGNQLTKVYRKMIKNWEEFREAENNLLGDRSRFINNDLEIERMIKEEEYIKKEIEEYNEDIKNNKINKDIDNYNELNDVNEYF
tara:strand:- start:576 stop:1178 length:603 start_codon:yes stop_codon:yes gene_type:complete